MAVGILLAPWHRPQTYSPSIRRRVILAAIIVENEKKIIGNCCMDLDSGPGLVQCSVPNLFTLPHGFSHSQIHDFNSCAESK